MIKKRTAIFFILLANIVILVHAAVPHHHHESQICIEWNHCQADCSNHNQNATNHNHKNDGSDCSDNCVLKQTVIIPSNSFRHELKCFAGDNYYSPSVDFQAIIFSNERISFVPKIVSVAQIPRITSSHSRFVSDSLGLRAPPTV